MSGQARSHEGREKAGRRSYEAPRLARVDLEAEEVLAIGCKMPRRSSAFGSASNCLVRACAAAGS